MRLLVFSLAAAAAVLSCAKATSSVARPYASPSTREANHISNIKQLTFGGDNAEAYFSADGKRLIFQSTRDGRTCDQQFIMNTDGSYGIRVSTGAGKTTCGYFCDGDRKIFFVSTHAADTACPAKPDPSKGYV